MLECQKPLENCFLVIINPLVVNKWFLKNFIQLTIFRQRERERGKETSMCGCLSCAPTRDLAHNPGMCPDWESNQLPFGLQVGTQSTEPHQPGQFLCFFLMSFSFLLFNSSCLPYLLFLSFLPFSLLAYLSFTYLRTHTEFSWDPSLYSFTHDIQH